MKTVKIINSVLAILVLLVLLSGCAKKEDISQEQSDTNSESSSRSSIIADQSNEYAQNTTSELIQAIRNNDIQTVKTMLAKGMDVNKFTQYHFTNPLLEAVHNRNKKIVEALISAGAKVNVTHFEGYTPLYDAVVQKTAEVVRLLLNALIQHTVPLPKLCSQSESYSEMPSCQHLTCGNLKHRPNTMCNKCVRMGIITCVSCGSED